MTRRDVGIIVAAAVALGIAVGVGLRVRDAEHERSTPATLTVGDVLGVDVSTMVDTAQAIAFDDGARAELCLTTISGSAWNAARSSGHWDRAINALTLAQVISPDRSAYDVAGDALMLTTISGKRYCANPARYAGGKWALALSTLAQIRAYLIANPAASGPTITTP